MGFHRSGQVAIGAFVLVEMRDYLDSLVVEHGLATRSDALRLVICDHMDVFSQEIDRNKALTLQDVEVNDDYSVNVNKRNDG